MKLRSSGFAFLSRKTKQDMIESLSVSQLFILDTIGKNTSPQVEFYFILVYISLYCPNYIDKSSTQCITSVLKYLYLHLLHRPWSSIPIIRIKDKNSRHFVYQFFLVICTRFPKIIDFLPIICLNDKQKFIIFWNNRLWIFLLIIFKIIDSR